MFIFYPTTYDMTMLHSADSILKDTVRINHTCVTFQLNLNN
jgi:hypothetical protein